jgi:hypothetical protein
LAAYQLLACCQKAQNEQTIFHFLKTLQHCEKQICGHNNLSCLKQINVDQSMAIIVSIIKCFNDETLDGYLDRCWRLIKVDGGDFKACIFHICLAHFMNTMKRKLLECHKKSFTFCMHALGLLANCMQFDDFNQFQIDFLVCLRSQYVTKLFVESHKRICASINRFDTTATESSTSLADHVNDSNNNNSSNCTSDKKCRVDRYAENENLVINSKSFFETYANNVRAEVEQLLANDDEVSDSDLESNDLYCLLFAEYFTKNYAPIALLWSCLLLGNLSKYKELKCKEPVLSITSSEIQKSDSVVERRFATLKHVTLHVTKRNRIRGFCSCFTF